MEKRILLLVVALLAFSEGCQGHAFTTQARHRHALVTATSKLPSATIHATARTTHSNLQMRDASSAYWFNVNDKVLVVDDVIKAGHSLKGRVGTVVETWEKCDVDPTCCCAEQVDLGMAVRVEFQGTEDSESESGSFMHYFAEEELTKVNDEEVLVDNQDNTSMPFDGMNCTAFKLDHLKMGEQAKRIAAYEQSQSNDTSTS